jgi:hypothetical protein
MASPRRALPEGVEDTVVAEIIGCLSSDETFSKSESFREQCANTCRILYTMHTLSVPFAAIARLFSFNNGTIHQHWQNFKARENVLRMRGHPTVLTTDEISGLVDVILNVQITRGPSSGSEVRGIIEKKYQKTVLLDTLCQILRRDRRVPLCIAVSIESSRLQVPEQAIRDYFVSGGALDEVGEDNEDLNIGELFGRVADLFLPVE